MKKMLFLFIVCLTTTMAMAQTITDTAIAGKWEMSGFDIEGVTWDFKTDEFRVPASLSEEMGQQELDALIAELKEGMAPLREGHISIGPGKKIEQLLMGEETAGTYAIAYENGQHYLDITSEGSDVAERLKISLAGSRMQLSLADEDNGEIVLLFDKIKQ